MAAGFPAGGRLRRSYAVAEPVPNDGIKSSSKFVCASYRRVEPDVSLEATFAMDCSRSSSLSVGTEWHE